MYVVKTALRESFDNIHVGFLYSSKNETIKIETDQGKISGERVTCFCILHVYEVIQCFIILAMDGAIHFSFLSHAKKH